MSQYIFRPGTAHKIRRYTTQDDGLPEDATAIAATWYPGVGASQTATVSNVRTGVYDVDISGLTATEWTAGPLEVILTVDGKDGATSFDLIAQTPNAKPSDVNLFYQSTGPGIL